MIVPRGRLARCSSRGDALFCLAGRKFAPAKIVRDEPWEVVWEEIPWEDTHIMAPTTYQYNFSLHLLGNPYQSV